MGCASRQARRAAEEAEILALATADPFAIVDQIELYDGDLRYLDLRRCGVVFLRLQERTALQKQAEQAIEAERTRLRQTEDSLTRAMGRVNRLDSVEVNRYSAAVALHDANVASANRALERLNADRDQATALVDRALPRCVGRPVKNGHLSRLPKEEREAIEPFIVTNVRGVRP
ncbi:MAG: hypothetical protein MUF00_09560 [Gemmatimonadaceae bacterium]|nr:hypothetical protein [Gemmatimonadaceae bacterium]